MHFDWSTLALQTVNFAILVWLLHRFLYQPVLRLVDARRTEIEKQYAEAHSLEARAKDQLAAVEAEQAGITAERTAALREAAAEAEDAAAARRARAEREATAMLYLDAWWTRLVCRSTVARLLRSRHWPRSSSRHRRSSTGHW